MNPRTGQPIYITSPQTQRSKDTSSSGWYMPSVTQTWSGSYWLWKSKQLLLKCWLCAVQKTMKKSTTNGSSCGHCTKHHTPGREYCSAKDSTCHSCQKIGHWKQKCRKSNKAKDAYKKPKSQPQQWHEGRKRADEVGVSEGDPAFDEVMLHAWLADQKRPEDLKQITICRHFYWHDNRSLCYCGYAYCIKEEGQPLMQGGHWCRRKCDAPLSLCKTLPKLVNGNWNVHRITEMQYHA